VGDLARRALTSESLRVVSLLPAASAENPIDSSTWHPVSALINSVLSSVFKSRALTIVELGTLGEFITSIAVMVTFIFLVVELRLHRTVPQPKKIKKNRAAKKGRGSLNQTVRGEGLEPYRQQKGAESSGSVQNQDRVHRIEEIGNAVRGG